MQLRFGHRQRKVAKSLIRIVVELGIYLIDSITLFFLPQTQPKTNYVLVVRLDHIGDFLIWSGQFAALRKKYPENQFHLTLLGNSAWTELAQAGSVFNEVWPINTQRLTHSLSFRIKLASQVRCAGFEIALNPTFSREIHSDSIVRFSGAKDTIGFKGDFSNSGPIFKRISDGWYTKLIETDPKEKNEIQRNAKFITGLGCPSKPSLGLFTNISDRPIFGLKNKNYFVIVPGASWPDKCWPIQNFVDISKLVRSHYGIDGVICGSRSEANLARAINEQLDQPLLDCTGKTTLIELFNLIKHARILIANDTSAAHISPIVDTPSVCIVGGGHFGRFLPYEGLTMLPPMRIANHQMDCYGCDWVCQYRIRKNQAAPCISRVSVDLVWNQIRELL